MKPICAMCGRSTHPFVMIGREAIGPKCAKRAGLTPGKAPKLREPAPKTGDLFEGLE